MTEQQIEKTLIEKLSDLKYTHRPGIRDRASLEQNFQAKLVEAPAKKAVVEAILAKQDTATAGPKYNAILATDRNQKRERLAEALAQAAAFNPYGDIADSIAWQREQRQDRPLPGRNHAD